MKAIRFITALMLLTTLFGDPVPGYSAALCQAGDSLKVECTPQLEKLVSTWINEFNSANKGVAVIKEVPVTGKYLQGSTIAFLPEAEIVNGEHDANWKLVVSHDAVIPVISSQNPLLEKIRSTGFKPSDFEKLIKNPGIILWSDIIDGAPQKPVTLYIQDDRTVKSGITAFTMAVENLTKTDSYIKTGLMISTVSKDVWSIGFCRLADAIKAGDPSTGSSVTFLPIDRNSNGKIDSFENIYQSSQTLLRGVWSGRYPHSLSGNIYAAGSKKPTDKNVLSFLKWIISTGDKSTISTGFSQLAMSEVESGLAMLAEPDAVKSVPAGSALSYSWVVLLSLIVITAALIALLLRTRRKRARFAPETRVIENRIFNEQVLSAPAGLYFDRSHTWAFMERDGLVRIGVDDFLQHVTGTITGVRLHETGDSVRRGEKLLTIIKDGKQLNIYSPVSGIIRSLNTDLWLDPSSINSCPYSDGWVYLVEPANWAKEIQMLFTAKRFREWIADEFIRLKDFLAAALKSHYPALSPVVLQDGGELTDKTLEKLSPEIWEEFQISFIDKSR